MTSPLVTNDFPAKWNLSSDCGNSILMTCHYPDLGSASEWSSCERNLPRPITDTQIWVVIGHQYGISAVVARCHFAGKPVMAMRNVG